MRVVAGSVGGRRLAVPRGVSTRPTSELVRGAVFNSLEARGVLDGASVADLFAGSGALGIEALSRGAAHVTFVEQDRRAAEVIARNLADLGLTDRARVDVAPVERWSPDGIDLVLADPPYGWTGWAELLARLQARPDVLVVAEADHAVEADGWEVVASKRHGGTVVNLLRPRGATRT
ncbi:MAG TPA: 16S rRNA (guanine(966)-N(2))-methyltransferase RsmD [Acidimicrobiales bacterium]|nr:16S rRNA (guanine(966)-N(2))-methyltransferase RsmD [Acidimicrobiales bacterium]